ncbi:MAG: pilus assembly protein CpaB [Gaiellaceae bacterium]|jgi:Flp pilus assembly protein CpaB|nr:pilus assembly protein CpaB [Gaiellaceae bacterium]
MQLGTKLISSKRGMMVVAAAAALLAGVLILIYLNGYRNSVKAEGAPVTVLIAQENIPSGTSGTAIAANGLFKATTMRESQLREGAFSDPTNLSGKAATHDIYKGAQLTASDFAARGDALPSELTGKQRMVAIPLDAAHGLIGDIAVGNHVDVFAGFNVVPTNADGTPVAGGQARAVLKRIITDIPVVRTSSKGGGLGSSTTKVIVKLTDKQAADLAFSSDNGKVWLALRPGAGAESSPPNIVTVETVLFGVSPIAVMHSFRSHR